LRGTVLLDFSRPLFNRSDEGDTDAAASGLDDTQSGGIGNSPGNGQADKEEQDTTGQSTQHVLQKDALQLRVVPVTNSCFYVG
jgi:hypothetical protein